MKQIRVKIRAFAAAVSVLLLLTLAANVFAYSSNSNVYIGLNSTNECSAMTNESESQLDINSTMSTNKTGNNQWSAQMNSQSDPSATPNPLGVKFMQYDWAIDGSGNTYGSMEYWTNTTHDLFNLHTTTLDTVGNVGANDVILIGVFANSSGVYGATYYYHPSGGTAVSQNIYVPHNNDRVPLWSWTLDIVAENNGVGSVTFSTGGGEIIYVGYSTLTWDGSQVQNCATGYGWGTGETSNMKYATPTTGLGDVYQNFKHG